MGRYLMILALGMVVAGMTVRAEEEKRHWAFEAVKEVAPPEVKQEGWVRNEIDRFVLAKMEEKGLRPSGEADRLVLLRRATLDLTGLPPTQEEMEAFVSDPSAEAYEKLIDRLLASPRYGERWGRHWLDVVRFGESHGYEQNHLRDNAWPYRDYVIRSFNEDKPYLQFVTEQLAGDVVGKGDPDVEVATGFLVAGVHDTVGIQNEEGSKQQRINDLEDIVSTTSAAFLGLTVGCARCHDHKFDPIPQEDFYTVAAVFSGVRHGERELPGRKGAEEKLAAGPSGRRLLPGISSRKNVIEFETTPAKFVRMMISKTNSASEPCIDELEIFTSGGDNVALASRGGKATASSEYPGNPIHRIHHLNDGKRGNSFSWISNETDSGWAQIELPRVEAINKVVWGRDGEENARYSDRTAVKYVIEVSEDGRTWKRMASDADHAPRREAAKAYAGTFTAPETVHLLRRGNVMRPLEPMAPAALSGIGLSADLKLSENASEGERRLALARWICDEKNPLTARVMVNRVWQYHFGRGIVNTPSDFGLAGEAPSHPELLNWLAKDFVRNGWKLKPLHRMIMLSSTYRQSPVRTEANAKIDGGNVYLWHMPLKRLEAEAIRDSILAVSGNLDLKMGGPGFRLFKYRVVNVAIYEPLEKQGPETWRRSVYHQWPRGIREDLLASFDFPETAGRSPRRDMTTNALQALTMLNSPFVVEQAEFFAERVRKEAGVEAARQVERAFLVALGRRPDESERVAAEALVRRHGLEVLCRGMFNLNEFLTY